jgi:hypothetical protein
VILCCQEKPLASAHTARTLNQHRWSGRDYRVNTLAVGSGGGWHKPVRSDCLLKTQVRAKSQDDVYGLTPARCWKVKRTG